MENKILDEIIKTAKESGVEVKITNDSDSLNVLDYIGSNDVAEYFQKIKYEFSPLAKFMLIASSGKSVTNVISELKQLLNNGFCKRVETLVARQEKELLTFLKEEENAFYKAELESYSGGIPVGLFSSYAKALAELKKAKDKTTSVLDMTIDKHYIDDEDALVGVAFNFNFEITETYSHSNGMLLRDFWFDNITEISVTLPFKPGDIVIDHRDNPYVMLNTPKWCESAHVVTIGEKETPEHNGLIDILRISNPGDLSYFRGKLSGKYEILKDISYFIRKYPVGIEDLRKLLNKYLQLYTQIEAEKYENI